MSPLKAVRLRVGLKILMVTTVGLTAIDTLYHRGEPFLHSTKTIDVLTSSF